MQCISIKLVRFCIGAKNQLAMFSLGGAIPDAAAIHAARKRRQAAREQGEAGGGGGGGDYLPLKSNNKNGDSSSKGRRNEHDEDSGDDDGRISFMGVRSDHRDRQIRRGELNSEEEDHDEHDHEVDFEEQQFRKALGGAQSTAAATNELVMTAAAARGPQAYPPGYHQQAVIDGAFPFAGNQSVEAFKAAPTKKPVAYNLQGIKGRLKERCEQYLRSVCIM